MNTQISIAGVSERDVDLLLLEEFHSCPSFQVWFVSKVIGQSVNIGTCVGAARSVTHSTGESDLEVTFADDNDRRIRILIENKVKDGLQPQQAERYKLRGESYVARGDCASYYTVICAPECYFGPSNVRKGFDHRITYEDLFDWFLNADHLGNRRYYKAALLQSAIEKGTLGYQPDEDAATTAFWRWYWSFSREHAPALEMREPGVKPAGSTFVSFHPLILPARVDILHKLTHGYVDLQLGGLGARVNELYSVIGPCLTNGMQIVRAGKSAAVRIEVPKLDTDAAGGTQQEGVRKGIDAAKWLLGWFEEHQERLAQFLVTVQQDHAAEARTLRG